MSWLLYDLARVCGLGGCGAFLVMIAAGGRRAQVNVEGQLALSDETGVLVADYAAWARDEKRQTLSGPEWWDLWHSFPEADRPYDSRDVACPSCPARAGVFCKRPSGHTSKQSHAGRWDAVLAAAVLRATS